MAAKVGLTQKERDYYSIISQNLEALFKAKGFNPHLEITADKKFSNSLKSKIPSPRQIIFSFLRNVAPDVTGYIEKPWATDFVIVEVKDEEIKLAHVYQLKKYSDLFEAKFSFLVSTKEILEELKRLCNDIYPILNLSSTYRYLALVHFADESQSFKDWHPKNPFEIEYLWR